MSTVSDPYRAFNDEGFLVAFRWSWFELVWRMLVDGVTPEALAEVDDGVRAKRARAEVRNVLGPKRGHASRSRNMQTRWFRQRRPARVREETGT